MFQLADLRTDGRLRAIAGLGGLGETLQPDNFEKCVELIKIHWQLPAERHTEMLSACSFSGGNLPILTEHGFGRSHNLYPKREMATSVPTRQSCHDGSIQTGKDQRKHIRCPGTLTRHLSFTAAANIFPLRNSPEKLLRTR